MANLTLVQAINLALIQEMERDERVLKRRRIPRHRGPS